MIKNLYLYGSIIILIFVSIIIRVSYELYNTKNKENYENYIIGYIPDIAPIDYYPYSNWNIVDALYYPYNYFWNSNIYTGRSYGSIGYSNINNYHPSNNRYYGTAYKRPSNNRYYGTGYKHPSNNRYDTGYKRHSTEYTQKSKK
jgi:hypothetical protein